jgi:photosystem II stability/assembly factor-like uncharacterized protein
MRSVLLALAASALIVPCAQGGDVRNFGDAALHAVQFIDKDEGWAVGDAGVIWHTIDAGKHWERQPTGLRASLRSLHFLNPYTGWVVGREELPHGGGSNGVLLLTRDGGLKWQQVALNALPGLERVRFLDAANGYVVGDGTEQFPTGVFRTTDGGKSWLPIPGPRCPTWLAADFQDKQNGALAGAWNRLGFVRDGAVVPADVDLLGGRSVHDLRLFADRAVAVGQGGLVLLSDEANGHSWFLPDLKLAPDVKASLDFHAVAAAGTHLWVAGRPGSVLLHSADAGKTWEVQSTGQPLPLHGLCFTDAEHGWAVGELGTILATADGGKSWVIQQHGGERAATLFIHARMDGLPVDAVAAVGGEEGYLTAALRVVVSDPASAPLWRASEPQRLAAAMRQAGGAASEMLWQFPAAQHYDRTAKLDLLKAWDRLHADRAREDLLRQLVLALRIWQPEVLITDNPDEKATGLAADALVAEAVCEAFRRAADDKAFPEQLALLGLRPCKAAKVYACWHNQGGAQVSLDLTDVRPHLQGSIRAFAGDAAALLFDTSTPLPAQRFFHLLEARSEGAAGDQRLMQGVVLGPGGTARRKLEEVPELNAEQRRVIQRRQSLEILAQAPSRALTDPARLLAQVGPELTALPEDQGAPAAFILASHYAHMGQWILAREAFGLMVQRYPAHPLSAEAYRWLIRYNSSSEARHRQARGQFLTLTNVGFQTKMVPAGRPEKEGVRVGALPQTDVREEQLQKPISDIPEIREWYKGGLELEPRLAAFGRLYAADPATQFCLQAARRHLGDFDGARQWYAAFASSHPDGPWRDAAAAELWMSHRSGPPPKPVLLCRLIDTRPFLDGKLDDSCWQGDKPLVLRNAVGDTVKDYPTEVWLAYDQEYLYLALRCRHPADRYVSPVKVRPRDADTRPYDRVTLLLDLDRDYTTTFNLHVDQRGCVCDDCWNDLTWDPRWFVAIQSEPTCWQIEAAIPLQELTGDQVKPGHVWSANVVRIVPGRGVQAVSVPADVTPRPEGMGLLWFGDAVRPPEAKEKARPIVAPGP